MSQTPIELRKSGLTAEIEACTKNCADVLEKLSATCCMPVRSERMASLTSSIQSIASSGAPLSEQDELDRNITQVEQAGKAGKAVGGLFVTCCAPNREKLYLKLIANLNAIHTSLWRLKTTAAKNH